MNFYRRLFLSTLVAAVVSGCSPIQHSLQPEPVLQPVSQADWFAPTDIKLSERVHAKVLPNGLRYLMVQSQSPKNNVQVRLLIKAGSSLEEGPEPGLAHFLEHMAFNGSKNIPEGKLIPLLQKDGIAFGADVNASTHLDKTIYKLSLPGADKLDNALMVMREVAGNLTLAEDAVDRERGVLESEVRDAQGPNLNSSVALLNFSYPGIKPSTFLPIGTQSGMESVTQEALQEFYNRYYTPDRMTLIVTGDMSLDATEKLIKHYFSDLQKPEGTPVTANYGSLKVNTKVRAGAFSNPDITTQVSLQFIEPPHTQPDTQQTRYYKSVRSIGLYILSRRLKEKVLTSDGQLMSRYSNTYTDPYANNLEFVIQTRPDSWKLGLTTLEQTIRQITQYGVTEDEVKEELAIIRKEMKEDSDAESTLYNSTIASDLIYNVMDKRVATTGPYRLQLFEKNVAGVTAAQVNEILKDILNRVPPTIFLQSSKSVANQEQEILDVYHASQKVAVHPYAPKAHKTFAYTNFGTPGKVVSSTINDYGKIKSLTFNNGTVLNFKHTSFKKGIASISIKVGKGFCELPKDKEGLIDLYGIGFLKGGVGKYSPLELHQIIYDQDIGLNSWYAYDGIHYSFTATPENLQIHLQLAAAYFTDPAYRKDGEQAFHNQLNDFIKNSKSNVYAVRSTKFMRFLYGGDKRWGLNSGESLQKLSFDVLKPTLKQITHRGPVQISIVGDVSESEAVQTVAKTFAALPTHFAPPGLNPIKGISIPQGKEVTFRLEGKGSDTALVEYNWKVPNLQENPKDTYKLILLRTLIEERLRNTLREELGASYSPQVAFTYTPTIQNVGLFTMLSSVKVADKEQASQAYAHIVAVLKEPHNISKSELDRAKQPLLESLKVDPGTNDYWQFLASELYLSDFYQGMDSAVNSITADDLTEVARHYLTPDRLVKSTIY